MNKKLGKVFTTLFHMNTSTKGKLDMNTNLTLLVAKNDDS
jgi:hypothetical protein